MRREKRTAQMKGYVRPTLRQLYEQFVSNDQHRSLSDFVSEALEDYAALRISKQKIGARVGNQ